MGQNGESTRMDDGTLIISDRVKKILNDYQFQFVQQYSYVGRKFLVVDQASEREYTFLAGIGATTHVGIQNHRNNPSLLTTNVDLDSDDFEKLVREFRLIIDNRVAFNDNLRLFHFVISEKFTKDNRIISTRGSIDETPIIFYHNLLVNWADDQGVINTKLQMSRKLDKLMGDVSTLVDALTKTYHTRFEKEDLVYSGPAGISGTIRSSMFRYGSIFYYGLIDGRMRFLMDWNSTDPYGNTDLSPLSYYDIVQSLNMTKPTESIDLAMDEVEAANSTLASSVSAILRKKLPKPMSYDKQTPIDGFIRKLCRGVNKLSRKNDIVRAFDDMGDGTLLINHYHDDDNDTLYVTINLIDHGNMMLIHCLDYDISNTKFVLTCKLADADANLDNCVDMIDHALHED